MKKVRYILVKVMRKILHPSAIKNSNIHKTSRVCSSSNVIQCNIDRYSYIGNNCSVIQAEIGSFCSIADNCSIGGASHPIEWVSTSPVFHEGRNIMKKHFARHEFNPYKKTVIGNDVWIGSNCLIKSGVVIGDGAIIGMGSVVTKNVAPYTIVAGNPIKVIRKRFSNDVIDTLLSIKWWQWEDEKIKIYSEKFNSIEEFVNSDKEIYLEGEYK